MKKIVIALVLIVSMTLVYSLAISESMISFRNVPWLSSPAEVSEIGFPDDELAQAYLEDIGLADLGTAESIDGLSYNRLSTTTPPCFKLAMLVDFGVAGYNVSTSLVIFAYDVDADGNVLSSAPDTKLVAGCYYFDHLDEASNHARALDLEAKLTGLYGEPAARGEDTITWYDNDQNALVLYNTEYFTSLLYKYHDADTMLQQAYAAAQNAAESPAGNTSGL